MSNPGSMIKAMASLQIKIAAIQKELAESSFEGTSGGGLVSLTLTGKHEVVKAQCSPDLLKEDADTVADLFMVAFNDANRKLEEMTKSKMAAVSKGLAPAGLNIPGLNLK